MKEILGVDIGGTNFHIGRVKNGVFEEESYIDTNRTSSKEESLNSLFESIDSHLTNATQAIRVGVSTVIDSVVGIVYDLQNIPSWKEIPLKDLLVQRYKLLVYINNDANCFALGEKIFRSGKDYKNFIGLSIGAGIDMGIIINNQLYNGVISGVREIGILPYKERIIEQYASSFFLLIIVV